MKITNTTMINLEDTTFENLTNDWMDALANGELYKALGTVNLLHAPGHTRDDMIVQTYNEVQDWASQQGEWDLYDRCEEQLNYWTDNAQGEALQDLASA